MKISKLVSFACLIGLSVLVWLLLSAAADKTFWRSEPAAVLEVKPSQIHHSEAPPDAAKVDSVTNSLPHLEPLTAFNFWTERYLNAGASTKKLMEKEGAILAEARRPVFKSLIKEDPKTAIESAVPMVVRQQLPPAILALLERRVNNVGALRVYQGVPLPGEPLPKTPIIRRVAELKNDRTYEAHVFGRRAETVKWTDGASLNGVALDSDFAVNEDPFRTLEVGEIPDRTMPALSICPVSGKQSLGEDEKGKPISEDTPAVQTALEVVYFCNGAHASIYRQTLIQAEGGTGGAFTFTGILPSAPTPSMGVVKVLYLPITYADQNDIPTTEATAYQTLRDVGDFYGKGSYGRCTLISTVAPPIKLEHTENWYVQRDTSNGGDIDGVGLTHSHAREAARRMGYDDNEYDCIVVRHNGGPGSYGGLGGGRSVWIRGDGASLSAHEIGHCFGLGHSNFWDTAGTSAIGAGTNAEYGDTYDTMGSGPFPAGHYNAQAKNQIQWLPNDYVQRVTQSGLYRIYAFDQPSLEPDKRYAMTIVKDAQRTYWGELRQLFTGNTSLPWADNGFLLGWRFPNGGGSNLQRIDTTPGSPYALDDAAISLGSTFSDFESGIHMTTVNVSKTDPKYIDVMVNMGSFPGNQAPTATFAASADVVPVNATVTFTMTATDPDGDALAYSWQHLGDTSVRIVSPSLPTIARTFTTAGTYIVSCTASDMKGGTVSLQKLITVGNGGGRYTISGRITLGGQGLSDVIVTANNLNGVVTDRDGYFTVPNLTANTYTLSPLLYGYSFAESFSNSITVGPSFTGANFTATAASVVTVTASIPTADETAPVTSGRFALTRTGDISQPLLVNVNTAQGSATKTTDYTFSPDYVSGSQGFNTFTIPSGQAVLNINVTPATDSLQEGPETVRLELGPASSYIVGTASTATVTINDDDTSLPKVSVTATAPSTLEGSGSPAVITFSRTGSTGAALSVVYTTSGTATSSSDYTPLSGTVNIPLGSTSATVLVNTINDSISEPNETVTLRASSNAAYIIDPTVTAATVTIVDDDVQIVNVAATDASAREVNLSGGGVPDTGTFVITRSGDISKALDVYYSVAGTPSTGVGALHGIDYEALPGVLNIPAGQPSASITILPIYDGFGEGNESVVLQLGAGSTAYQLGSASSGTVTISDSVSDVPYLDVEDIQNAAEPSTNGTFRITARGAGTSTITVNFAVSGSATPGSDFTITGLNNTTKTGSTTITMNNGATVTKDITVTTVDDATSEPLETVVLSLTPDPAYSTFAASSSASMWLRDNEVPTLFVDAQVGTSGGVTNTITEGSTTSPVKFWISRSGATTSALLVNYTLSGTATASSDYNAMSGNVTIPIGASGVDVPLTIINDTAFEGTESVIFNFAPGSYSAGPGAQLFIADNETSAQNVGFTSSGSSGLESVGTVSIPVRLTTPATVATTVDYVIDSGSRSASVTNFSTTTKPYWMRLQRAGNTFTATRSPDGVTWTAIGTPITMTLPPDVLAGLAVSSRSDGILSTATFDNVSFSPSATIAFGGRTVGFVNAQGSNSFSSGVHTVIGSGAGINISSQDECHFASQYLSGDFTLTARILSQSGGATTQQAGIMIREGLIDYRGREIYLGYNNAGLEFVTRSSGITTALGAGVDHDLTSGTLTFAVGDQTKNITFNVNDDSINEPDENLTILLRNSLGAQLGTSLFNYTVIDNDVSTALPFVAFAGSTSGALEGSATANILVSLSSPATSPVSVNYSVTGGTANGSSDYTLANGTLNFTVGQSIQSFAIALADDAIVEPNETITLSLASPTGAQLGGLTTHTFTITDDDLPVVTITASDASATEAAGDTGLFTISRTGPTTAALSVNLSASGTATTAADYTSIPASISIPIGSSSASVLLSPVQDTLNEGDETVVLTVSSNAAYNVGNPATATATIMDDDRSIVNIVATDDTASETPGNIGQFTITRSAPTNVALTVPISISGTATNGTDYNSITSSVSFAAGDVSKVINVTPTNDALIEGTEIVTVSLGSGSFSIGANPYDNVNILDDDIPPSVFVSSPSAQGTLIASGQGIIVTATGNDDGLPSPITYTWSQVSGPGTAIFETPTSASSAVTFSANGTYVLRISVTDGQFTAVDQTTVIIGNAAVAADWIDEDMGPSSARRGQGLLLGSTFTVSGTGSGYASTNNDTAHITARQMSGDASIIARINTSSGSTSPFIGVTMRDLLARNSKRVVFGIVPGTGLQLRTRVTDNTNDSVISSTAVTTLSQPLWVKLERNSSTNEFTASYAPDVAGAAGVWTQVGTPTVIAMDAIADVGLTVTSNNSNSTAVATFDNVSLTPAPAGVAVITEDLGINAPNTSSFSLSGGTYTIAGSGSIGSNGAFYGWQYYGDFTIIAKHASATSNAGSAASGIMIRESMDSNSAYAHLGRLPTTAFGGFFWRSVTSGATDNVPSFGGAVRWMKMVRQGNTVTGYHAPDSGGSPGTWAQLGQPQTIIMPDTVLVGFAVDNASGVGLNTVTFSNLSLTPLNQAPNVSIASVPNGSLPPVTLNGTVTDDNFPTPVSLTTLWSAASAPGSVTFNNPLAIDTTAAFGTSGNYRLRLTADDTTIQSFRDVSFSSAPGNSPPFIAIPPANLSVNLGQPATFSVTAYGGTLSYQWQKGTTNLPSETNDTLTIPATSLGDAGNYRVIVTNSIGSTTSIAATLEVVTIPVVTTDPLPVQINVGQSTTLSVVASGLNLTYQWRKNGVDIPGKTSSTYTITNAATTDTGDYSCLVTNSAGSDLSASVFVGVVGIPTITAHPTPSTIAIGSGFSFSVTAAGLNLSYQWQFSSGSSFAVIPAATSPTYSPPTSSGSNAGNYRCVVTNSAGSTTSNAAALTVISPAVITKQPTGSTAVNGSTVFFSTTATGVGISYQWQKDTINIPSATSSTLFLNNIQTIDAADYRCVITNLAGPQYTNTAKLVVVYPPIITNQPNSVTIDDGQPGAFSVIVNGVGLTYRWQKNGVDIPGATSSTFAIAAATGIHVGSYRCLVSNIAGSAASTPVDLNINGAPAISLQPQNVYAEAGANGQLIVVASIGNPTYQWYRNGTLIPSANTSSLSLPNIQTAATGNYNCVIANAVTSVTTRTAVVSLVTDLGKGIDDSTHKWLSTGPVPWVYQTGTTHDLIDSLLIRSLKDNEASTAKITVTGPATVRFWWKTSSQVGDALSFEVDGVPPAEILPISGDSGWQQVAYVIGPGVHELAWTYEKDASGSALSDWAWIDELRFDPPFTIVTQPESQLVPLGSSVTFSVVSSGLPTTYQWKRNGNSILGATSSSYTVSNATAALAGDYSVVLGGVTTSSIAKLWVVGDPAPARIAANGTALLPLTVGGSGLTFQWFDPSSTALGNTSRITGASTNKLSIKSCTLADEGGYSCEVTAPGIASPLVITPCIIDIVSIPVITSTSTEPGIVSGLFSWQLTATDFPSGFTISNLPRGLTYNAQTGLISGIPDVSGDFTIKVSAKNAAGTVSNVPLSFHIASLPDGTVGDWSALIARDPSVGVLGGYLTLSVGSTGTYTAKLVQGDSTYAIKNRITAENGVLPTAHHLIVRKNLPPLTLDLTLDHTGESLAGTLQLELSSTTINGARHVWKTGRTCTNYAGTYNCSHEVPSLLLHLDSLPQGACYTHVQISDLGGIAISGKINDGTAFTQNVTLWPNGRFPTFIPLHSGKTSLHGTHDIVLGTSPLFADNSITGTLTLQKTGAVNTSDRFYASGFPQIALNTYGGKYNYLAGAPIMGLDEVLDNAAITFSDGGIATAEQINFLGQTFSITNANAALFPNASNGNPCKVSLSLTAKTGIFTGSFSLLDAGVARSATITGVILSHNQTARGSFLLPELPTPLKSQKLSGFVEFHASH